MFKFKLARLVALSALATGSMAGVMALSASSVSAAPSSAVLYNSIPNPLPGNLPSQSFEATETAEIGNAITIASPAPLSNVVVTMSSWGCQSGSWTNDTCSTTPGATFPVAISLNLFTLGAGGAVGTSIGSDTQTFNIPFRPSADNVHCTGSHLGEWYDAASNSCFNGMDTNITFDFSALHVVLPTSFIYGVQYNTSDWGTNPLGDSTACHSTSGGCGYDSLNVALSSDGTDVTTGSDVFPGKLYQNTQYAPYYCDNGAAGTGTFRLDSPGVAPNACTSPSGGWSISGTGAPYYVPAVQFNAPAPTSLATQAAILELGPKLSLLAGPTATLSGPSGPIAGQTVNFTTPAGAKLCSAVTNSAGLATCGTGQALASLLALGYNASYAGSGTYDPTAAKGSLIVVLGITLL